MKVALPFGLLAAILAVLAFGAAAAPATTLCKKSQAPECPAGERYAVPTSFDAVINSPSNNEFEIFTIWGGLYCEDSEIEGTTTGNEGAKKPLDLEIEEITAAGECDFGGIICETVTWEGLPYGGAVVAGGLTGNGFLFIEEVPEIEFSCGGLFTCRYGTTVAELDVVGSKNARFVASEGLVRKAGPPAWCDLTATWRGEYVVVSPSPLFVSAEP